MTEGLIQVNEDFRIVTDDPVQYILQRRGLSKGELVWVNLAFFRTAKAMKPRVREIMGDHDAVAARKLAYKKFDDSNLGATIVKLKNKTSK
tara:strand:- start:996 stop:1268 length:273 start_codon:yes stop_codon:yes gene_type:complete